MAYLLIDQKNNIEFKLLGNSNIVIEAGNEYIDTGFIAKTKNKSLNNKVNILTNVNTNILGSYVVKYNLKINYFGVDQTL